MSLSAARNRRPMQAGASLVEVLVAILIVSMGVIAMAGMLATSTRLGKASEFRAVATLLAADISERMKANIGAAKANSYDQVMAFASATTATNKTCSKSSTCSAADLASKDLYEWNLALANALPSGRGYVAYDSTGVAMDVWVAWIDPNALSDSDYDSFEATDTASGKARCPTGYTSGTPKPRCMYFRVALS